MNKVSVPVAEILSYQTLVKQKRYGGRYRTERYHSYRKELAPYVRRLRIIENPDVPVFIHITFNVRDGIKPDEWRLIMKETGNTSRVYYSEDEALENKKKRHIIEHSPAVIRFGVTGDDDNIVKPIKDLMEDLAIIPNDRQGCYTMIEFTYNNKFNSIDIELDELEVIIDDDGVYRFIK